MEYKKYMHVELYGNDLVKGIEKGRCYIFPKIDGGNATAFLDAIKNLRIGGRNREYSYEDNQGGLYQKMLEIKGIRDYLGKYPNRRLYGEFLTPHSIKYYRDDAWDKFYVFDVVEFSDGKFKYLPYEEYFEELTSMGVDVIPVYTITNDEDEFTDFLVNIEEHIKNSNFLLDDTHQGMGEGFVIKNYDFTTKQYTTIWAKIISKDYTNKAYAKKDKASSITNIESVIALECVTESLVEKEKAKITVNEGYWDNKFKARLFNTIYNCVVREELWDALKRHKNPTINFKIFQGLITKQANNLLKDNEE